MSGTESPNISRNLPFVMDEEAARRMWTTMETLTANMVALNIENRNRTEEIQRIAKELGYRGEVETDKEPELTEDQNTETVKSKVNLNLEPELTEDLESELEVKGKVTSPLLPNKDDLEERERNYQSFRKEFRNHQLLTEEEEEKEAIEHRRLRNEQLLREREELKSLQPRIEEEEKINAKLAIETIRTINGQDDIGVEDFINNVKRAKARCTQPNLLLDLILAKKIQGTAEKATRYTLINSFDDLYTSLRQNLKQTGSVLAIKSKLESCKQGITETVQNFSLRFRQLTNELNYAVQAKHVNQTERRVRLNIEEEENINRYLLNLRKEIGLQVRLLKPSSLSEAQSHATETEMWIKESQPARQVQLKPLVKFQSRPNQLPRYQDNTTPIQKAYNYNTASNEKMKIKCHRCGNLGHIANQCTMKVTNFQTGQFSNRPPHVRNIQALEEELENETMTTEELQEQRDYENQAEYLPSVDDYNQLEEETAEEMNTTY